MAEQTVFSVTIPVGAVGTANRSLMHVPSGYGGITLLNAWLIGGAAGTIVSQLVNMGTALGTAVSSVVGTLTDGTLTANVRKPMSITTAYQAENTWLGLNGITGTTDAAAQVVLEYKFGK